MKLEVGMYVRTNKEIFQVRSNHTSIENKIEYVAVNGRYTHIDINTILKASHNIIDLIEVGDIITFKDDEDVYRIISIPMKEMGTEDFYLAKNFDGYTEDMFVRYEYMKEHIKSIVTKELFESMEYKVGE